jgi:hypothetical protein
VKASWHRSCDAQNKLGVASCTACGGPRTAEMAEVSRVGIQSAYVHRAE